jgi:hypothetical protein
MNLSTLPLPRKLVTKEEKTSLEAGIGRKLWLKIDAFDSDCTGMWVESTGDQDQPVLTRIHE